MASRDENIPRNIEVPSEKETGKAWLFHRIVFAKSVLFILGLVVSYSIVEYGIVCELMLFLVDEMGQSLMISAIIINAFDGVSAIFSFLMAYIADAYTNCFNVTIFSTGAYAMGLILLWIAADNWAFKEHAMFGVAIVLIAVGKSGRGSTLQSFLQDQLRASSDQKKENDITEEPHRDVVVSTRIWWHSAWICGYIIALLISPHLMISSHDWLKYLMISSHMMGTSYLVFYSGFFCYVYMYIEDPPRRPFGINFTKLKLTSYWELLLWASFIGYSMVLSSGNTLFIAQTANTKFDNNMAVSVSLLFVVKSIVSDIIVFFFWCIKFRNKDTNGVITLARIGFGMICAVLCCATAREVEIHRLYLIKKEGIRYPSDTISMSVLWLIPQYCLLGATEGLVSGGFVTYNKARINEPMGSFVSEVFGEVVLCLGKFGSILVMLISRDMFGEDINSSHMDSYFLVLATLSSVFFCFYLVWSVLNYGDFKGSKTPINTVQEGIKSSLCRSTAVGWLWAPLVRINLTTIRQLWAVKERI